MRALEIDPNDYVALFQIGVIKYYIDDVEESKSYFRRSVELGYERAQEYLSRLELTGSLYE
jgi:hypothetical protein